MNLMARWTAAIVLLGVPGLLGAQTVTAVSGSTITFSLGSRAGVSVGMTGKVCYRETVGGSSEELCPAKFAVTEVRESSATAQVTKGDAAVIARGHSVKLDQALVPRATATPRPAATPAPAKALSGDELLARGNRLFDVKDWAGAAAAFRELVERFPGHPEADYARKLLAAADERVAAARAQSEAADRQTAAAARAEELAKRAERLLVAEQWAEAKALAEEALALAADNERALAVKRTAKSHLGPARELVEPRSGVKFLLIAAGSFSMGCTAGDGECDSDERPVQPVVIPRGFYLAETETTVGQFGRFVAATGHRTTAEQLGSGWVYNGTKWEERRGASWRAPGFSQGESHPVVLVSWDDAKAFCEWAGGRLPSEAEWEYAARGGQEGSKYPWGNSITHDNANYGKDQCCGGLAAGRDQWLETSPGRSFAANFYGLYDMSGNVWEWVADCWHGDYSGAPSDGSAWTSGGDCSQRVLRGGSWISYPWNLRVSSRIRNTAGNRGGDGGFRCQRTAIP